MNEQIVVEKKKTHPSIPSRGDRAAPKSGRRYPPEFRLKAVRLHLEEGFSQSTVCAELGIGHSSFCKWIKAYRQFGEAGLQPAPPNARSPKLPPAIRDQVLALKKNGTLVKWGNPPFRKMVIPAGLSNVVAIAAGAEDFCLAITTNSDVAARFSPVK